MSAILIKSNTSHLNSSALTFVFFFKRTPRRFKPWHGFLHHPLSFSIALLTRHCCCTAKRSPPEPSLLFSPQPNVSWQGMDDPPERYHPPNLSTHDGGKWRGTKVVKKLVRKNRPIFLPNFPQFSELYHLYCRIYAIFMIKNFLRNFPH